MKTKKQILKEFQIIPGVGKSIAEDLWDLGYRSLDDLKGQNPNEMYEKLCEIQKCKLDRCLLYVFRCACYFSDNDEHDPELLKWWNWKGLGVPPKKILKNNLDCVFFFYIWAVLSQLNI